MSGLSLTLLGPPEVRLDGHLLKFRSRKALALLAYLATEGGVRSRDELVALFWPESDESRGRTALRSTLSYVKEPLGRNGGGDAGYLLIERNALGFDFASDYVLDLAVLRSAFEVAQHQGRENGREEEAAPLLEEAIRACRGDFMQGFQLPDAPEFDYWLDVEREGWRRRADAVFDRLSLLRIEAGEVVRAEEVADRWAKRSRTNEVAHRRLMEARFEAGDRAGAIEAYEGLRATLEREIGVAPGPETQALAERFRTKPGRGAPARPPAGDPAGAAPPGGASERGGAAPEPPFVGRTEGFAALVSAYREARADGTRALAVVGEGGVGKTRLIEEFLGWASADGGDVLHGRAFETEEHLPYGVLVDALRARIEHERAPDDLLPDVWLAELSRLLPELRDRYPDLPEPASDETTARTGLFEAIARLGEALAERTTVIVVVEDAHRADTATLDALRYAARRWAETGAPVLVLASLRPEVVGPEHAASQWLRGLGRVLPVGHLALEPLTLEDTAGLLRKLSPAGGGEGGSEGDLEGFAGWMHRETGGKPFFLAETLKALVERGALLSGTEGGRWVIEVTPEARGAETPESLLPRGVRDLIRARLGELNPAAFELLAAGAVLGRRFTMGHLCRVAGLAENDCLAGLEELLNRRLLTREEEDARLPAAGYSFAHDKIRAVTYEGAGEERLRAFHRRALEVLGGVEAAPAELARHARTAGLLADAFRYGLEAGDAAMKLSAARDAIANYERARVLLFERDAAGGELRAALPAAEVRAVYVGLGRARELAGEAAEARAAYEELLRLAREAGERSLEWTALVRLAVLRDWEGGDPDGARGLLEGARRAALAEGSHAGLAETEWNLAQVEFFARGPRAALDHARETLGRARRLGLAELTAHSSFALAYFGAFSGEWEEVPARAGDARTCYTALREGPPLPTALRPSGFYRFSLFAGPRPSPLVDYRSMEAESLLLEGLGRVHLGRPREGLEAARTAEHIGSETNSAWTRSGALLVLAAAATEAGEYGAAREAADGGLRLARELEHPHLPFRLLTLGAVRQATLQLEAARGCFEEALTLSRNVEGAWTKPYEVACATWLCANRALAGDWGAAHDYARRASKARAATPVTALFSDLVRHHETEALLRGGGEDARRDAGEAARRFAERVGNNPRHRIPSFCQRAALARWEGRVGEAIEHLRSAARLAEDLDLPGQLWQLRAATGDLHRKLGDEAAARISYGQAARGLEVLAASIPDGALVEDFRRVPQVRRVYEGRRRGMSWTPLRDGPDAPTAAYGRWATGG